ncbi:hypothetical protein evm_010718 [Chilo suppressalis]|nr:hypothetical protein evm_010718 [Chilo suppressalis]
MRIEEYPASSQRADTAQTACLQRVSRRAWSQPAGAELEIRAVRSLRVEGGGEEVLRARHTPAVRAGPPLSCNFCWNTVDDAGRILRRKTQYHCPECRKNLCIVPCFHEYHDDATAPATAVAVAAAPASASSADDAAR